MVVAVFPAVLQPSQRHPQILDRRIGPRRGFRDRVEHRADDTGGPKPSLLRGTARAIVPMLQPCCSKRKIRMPTSRAATSLQLPRQPLRAWGRLPTPPVLAQPRSKNASSVSRRILTRWITLPAASAPTTRKTLLPESIPYTVAPRDLFRIISVLRWLAPQVEAGGRGAARVRSTVLDV